MRKRLPNRDAAAHGCGIGTRRSLALDEDGAIRPQVSAP